jgi:hypothetical protein
VSIGHNWSSVTEVQVGSNRLKIRVCFRSDMEAEINAQASRMLEPVGMKTERKLKYQTATEPPVNIPCQI